MFNETLTAALKLYPGYSPRSIKRKALFVAKVLTHRNLVSGFCRRMRACKYHPELALDPHMLGLVEWPYLNNLWSVGERFDAVATHYELIDQLSNQLRTVDRQHVLLLCDLGYASEGASIAIDRPPWFVRESELVLNLFQKELRVASLAFTLGRDDAGLKMMIGAVQGIHSGVSSEESLDIFRKMTKDFEGLRPRSLLIEALRMIAACIGAKTILAVADQNRHHRHPYFGIREQAKFSANYDDIWNDHEGVPGAAAGFYELPLMATQKSMADIPSKKRAMYRRRQELVDVVRAAVERALHG